MRRGSTLNSIEKNEIPVMISVRGEQYFDGVDPDATELMTEGTLETTDTGLQRQTRAQVHSMAASLLSWRYD